MNKKVLAIIIAAAAIVIIGIGTFIVLNLGKTDDPTSNTTSTSTTGFTAVKACDALTLDEAKTILGDAATAGDNSDQTGSESLSVDTCSYTNNAVNYSDLRLISIMARSALDEQGKESNAEAFAEGGAARMNNAEAVSGYGDAAFWDATMSQLAVLDGNTWYGIVYSNSGADGSSLEEAKKVADLIVK